MNNNKMHKSYSKRIQMSKCFKIKNMIMYHISTTIKFNMKLIIPFLITFTCNTNIFSQKTYDDLISECYQIDIKNNKICLIYPELVERRTQIVRENGKINVTFSSDEDYDDGLSIKKIAALIKKDVFYYFNLDLKYNTPLQKKAFSKTKEYSDYMTLINNHHSDIFDRKFYILYNLKRNNPYNLNKKVFVFEINPVNYSHINTLGYLGLGKNINVFLPNNLLTIKKREHFPLQTITIPISDENLALKIEQDMEKYDCSTYLMFIVKLNGIKTEKSPTFIYSEENILTKTLGLYIVNTETKEIYCDLTKLLNTKSK
ncbi:MAG: hypothetical protein H6Q15_476 [Bacteroidetes bacterium]|nr:hypothetical protein [Bacteroidota bacterium]